MTTTPVRRTPSTADPVKFGIVGPVTHAAIVAAAQAEMAREADWDADTLDNLADILHLPVNLTATEAWAEAQAAHGAAVLATLVELAEHIANEHPDAAYLNCMEGEEGTDLRAVTLLDDDGNEMDVDEDDIDPDYTLNMLDDSNRDHWAAYDDSIRHRKQENFPRLDLRAILATKETSHG